MTVSSRAAADAGSSSAASATSPTSEPTRRRRTATPASRRPGRGGLGLGVAPAVLREADLGGRLGLLRRVVELARLEVEGVGDHGRREDLDQGVVGLDRVVVDAAGDLDLVLGLRQLALELLEVLCGSQLGVLLGDDHQPPDRRAQGGLGAGLLRRGVAVGRDRGAARPGHVLEGLLLVLCVALDRLDQVRDQVVAALQRGLDLGPAVVDGVPPGDHAVVDQQRRQRQQHDEADHDHESEAHRDETYPLPEVGAGSAAPQPAQHRLRSVEAIHAVRPRAGGRGGRADVDAGDAGGVGVEGEAWADHHLDRAVGAGDDVAADVVGVGGLDLGGGAGRRGDDPLAQAGREALDLGDDRFGGVARVAAGDVGVGPDRVDVAGRALGDRRGTAGRPGRRGARACGPG